MRSAGDASATTRLRVDGEAPYEVVVGHDLAGELPGLVGGAAARVALLHDAGLEATVVPFLEELRRHYEVLPVAVHSGERGKDVTVAARCWEALGDAGFTRSDVVVTLGGGATTDLGGFVAATWLRGVPVVHVPTTVLGMVDAAVGGKTGINTAAGKNLVGAFHEPAGVVCDLGTLRSLPRAELVSGLGEAVKCGFIADPVILELLEAPHSAGASPDSSAPTPDSSATSPDSTGASPDSTGVTADSALLRELVERAIRVKIDVVTRDLRETGAGAGVGREVLNYGHTLAHAIERVESYGIRHGEAVAIGCVYAAELSHRAGRLSGEVVRQHRRVFSRVGLPVSYAGAAFDDLRAAMAVDKKTRGHQLRFLVLDDVARPGILAGPDEEWLREAYDALAQRPPDPDRAGGPEEPGSSG